MKKETIKKYLGNMFEMCPKEHGEDVLCFRSEYMRNTHEAYPIYQAISTAQHDSELTFNFSYSIASPAVDVVANMEDFTDDDEEISEAVDSAVPVYTSELMEIYQANSWAVDEAVKKFGQGEDSAKNAAYGWFMQIEQMAQAIRKNLKAVTEENDNE